MLFIRLKSVGIVVACAFAGQAALAQGVSYGGGSAPSLPFIDDMMPPVSLGAQSLTWTASSISLGMSNAVEIGMQALDSSALNILRRSNGMYKSVSLTSPLTGPLFDQSIPSPYSPTALALPTTVTSKGGLLLSTREDPEGFAATGGSLSLSNWVIDSVNRRVLVDVEGANGVGKVSAVSFFDLGAMTATPSSSAVGGWTGLAGQTSFASMALTKRGFEMFATSLGLTDAGTAALDITTTFGTLSAGVVMSAVPETSQWALSLLGILGVVYARSRKPGTSLA